MLQDPNVELYIENAVNPLRKEIDQMKAQIEALNQALRINDVAPSCDGNCGMNYCDDNGCIERKRNLVNPTDLPEPTL